MSDPTLSARFHAAQTFRQFLDSAEKLRDLWLVAARRAVVSPQAVARVAALPGPWHLLVLNEDWCGDSVNTLPFIARLAEQAPNVDLRVVGRDANPDLMDLHLTNGARSIPAVIAYDEAFVERGWWGPRPSELQRWVLGPGWALDKAERYKEVRRWYARDAGRTTVEEVVAMLEAAAAARDAERAEAS